MASLVTPDGSSAPTPYLSPLQRDARFFTAIAIAFAILTLLGFSTTYLLPVAAGRFSGAAILHVHGVLFLLWPMLFLAQTATAARARRWHRALGMAGISLATAMLLTGLLAIGSSVTSWAAIGIGAEAQAISIVAFSGVLLFASLFAFGIANARDRATHARLMAIATLTIMQGVWGRLALMAIQGGNPQMLRPGLLPPPPLIGVMAIHLVFDLLFLGLLALHDRRAVGRIHPATLCGGGALLLVHSTRHLFVTTAGWKATADWLAAL